MTEAFEGERHLAPESNLGPPLHPVWREFTITVPKWAYPGKQHPDVVCNHCKKALRHAQPKKSLVPHIVRQCPSVSDRIRAKFASLGKRVCSVPDNNASPKRARVGDPPRQPNVHDPVSKKEKKAFHQAISAAFYSSGIPFRVIENPAMRFILTKYRPGMTLPTRHDLAGALLDEAYSNEWEKVKVVLEGERIVAVVCDGWSDPNSESIVNFMVVSPFIRPIFWSSVRTKDDKHTGEYMATELTKVIDEVEKVVGKGSVSAVVTHNAANMVKSWELLMAKMSALTCNGCSAHTLNLVLKDMFGINYLGSVLKRAVSVTKFVRKRPALLYHFREVQRRHMGSRQRRRALVIPVSTRWYSSTSCISSLVRNEEVLREVFANEALLDRYKVAESKLNRVKTILADSSFWMEARAILRLAQPVVNALGALEKDGCCLSMVYHYFRELRYHRAFRVPNDDVEENIIERIKAIIQKRWNSMKRESVLAAYLLDPSKSPENFDDDDLDKAVTSCVELAVRVGLQPGVTATTFRDAVMKFIRAKDAWSQEKWEQASSYTPLDWWRLKSGEFDLVRDFAIRVLSVPTSSAASERSWSIHSFIHNKRRNRLKPARVEKLAFLYTNVGDKASTSQVHYIDGGASNISDCVSDSSTDSYFSDEEPPRAPSHIGSTNTRAQNPQHNLVARRSLFGLTPPGRAPNNPPRQSGMSLLATGNSPVHPFSRPSFSCTRSSHTELPLSQTTAAGRIFTRADEFHRPYGDEGAAYLGSTPTVNTYTTPVRRSARESLGSWGTRSQHE